MFVMMFVYIVFFCMRCAKFSMSIQFGTGTYVGFHSSTEKIEPDFTTVLVCFFGFLLVSFLDLLGLL